MNNNIFNAQEIDKQANQIWDAQNVYQVEINHNKPKYYVLDMFPYPSGAGLHVGHPLGYVFSDIQARYKRMQGFNVLHPMGFDAFGLPAEQYAIQTGQHPAITTKKNIETFKKQLAKIGFSFDWSREVITCDPSYYKHTQWIFLQLFNAWYDNNENKAKSIDELKTIFTQSGNTTINAACGDDSLYFTAEEWNNYDALQQQQVLMQYRLAYQSEAMVNWCPELGTVLANDEVVNGVSERGGFPVIRQKMTQWFLRITAYADRLLQGLDTLDWSHAMKEMQRNWIGKSKGASVKFPLQNHDGNIEVFTTRVDTIFGVSFLVIAPEHELVQKITTNEYKNEVETYILNTSKKSDIERQAEVKESNGQFTGAFVLHPFTQEKIPVYIADYVLASYGTGAVMAVPSGDQRDFLFAKKYNLPIIPILDAQQNLEVEADATKEGKYINSDFINGMDYQAATDLLIAKLEALGLGKGKIQFKMRDAGYSRQRYWGEPFPIYYDENGLIHTVDKLPVELPEVSSYKPTGTGESPLANATKWVHQFGENTRMETDTMPGYAGSSWYFLRYMDAHNNNAIASKESLNYWQSVDFYVGGNEHAVGHLLYSRFWHKFLYDLGIVPTQEPFQKMVNQGMIQGRSLLTKDGQINGLAAGLHIPIELTQNDKISKANFEELQTKDNRFENIDLNKDVNWEEKDGEQFLTLQAQVEKMSKSLLNVVNPDDIINEYGADTFRMYEMFLGPIDASKPWDTNGISGVYNFLRKFWRLFFDDEGNQKYTTNKASEEELKIVHKCIKKITEDIERLSFNTCISSFMIAVNDYGKIKQANQEALELLLKLMSPFAPHITETLWHKIGHQESIVNATFPICDESYLVENTITYPVQINGKLRANIQVDANASKEEVEKLALNDEQVLKYIENKTPKKVIVVPNKIVNIVL
ncbi:MAG: leucine--tRNA ligase [Chitinophagales bacterium]|nr:leucine--tRNA ligase [Chitinophagales bacterium]